MKSTVIFLLGAISGALFVTVIWPIVFATTTYTARQDLVVLSNTHSGPQPFVIPKGTVFVHDAFFTEGFDSLKLFVNAADRGLFVVGKSNLDRIPCWVAQEQSRISRPPDLRLPSTPSSATLHIDAHRPEPSTAQR